MEGYRPRFVLSGSIKMIERNKLSIQNRPDESYEHYELDRIGDRWSGQQEGYGGAYIGSIRHTDEILFALALTTIIFGAVFSIALVARVGAFQ